MNVLAELYKREVKEYGYKEDMGKKYERKFNDIIGDEYSYPHQDRLSINALQRRLSDIVSNPI
jgi:hypothetical protein